MHETTTVAVRSIFISDIHLGTRFSKAEALLNYGAVLAQHAKHNNYDGVICGHIHKAEMRYIEGIRYLNCGDWVESCTAIVETLEGEWKIVSFREK
ncbi:hypothetical protein [Sulfurimonas hydrogeniphila]|uniref:hypothetical protein n=1 Tax=Sulfurimonas hydrogeniphila TaxID=2509341 RepID=UPI00324274B0